MKKTWKKATALTLAGTMALSLTGVGGKEASDSAAVSANGKPTITFMATSFQGNDLKNEGSDKVIQMYEDYTGIHVDWRWENQDTYQEKLGLTLMDRENMPMILTCANDLQKQANVVDAAKKGAFWDLRPFLEDKEAYPNLSQADPDIMKALTVDNQVIGIYRGRYVNVMVFLIVKTGQRLSVLQKCQRRWKMFITCFINSLMRIRMEMV